ncbi:lysophospholipid acyltransferase family protein [Acetobacter oeni]|uniref:1-acyl-sn-glycerol-3-phosphate acyltransferase n=1 Tax=Acetobacter oeni TaxID=304077 RepID=A0A511XGG9_9PROT|nr:lysophospholipid acyltransferase family protein [Acetobacter oeni]MBB3881785.1 1-acyl-sn-glycerol-3-phosphate acyltransferase [Acetobacter oeni]NHO17413.1 1-acyl-sn-glycerol-3-phosphate acyltransferase [Acetobacter oeni]GBR02036.1 1-acyl-sn-glycerol-3-phosphate acyltransferase [Acetobacter oeni LMG 21952]GEN62043.1 1-acyl-sn-glycerol-3-phosphate acyltransferase [Acetobacter oeni]
MIMLRSAAFRAYLVVATILLGLVSLPLRAFAHGFALPYARLWSAVLLEGMRRICRIKTRVIGLEKLPLDRPFIIASQHQSAFDTLVWMTLVPRPAYVMKQELLRVPFMGPMLKLTGMIAIERTAGSKAMRALLRETDRAAKEGRQMIIFPEGSRLAPGEKTALRPGIVAMARHTRLPVYPVVTNSGLFWPNKGILKRPGTISIVVCDPVEGADRRVMLGAIEQAWRDAEPLLVNRSEAQHPLVDNSVG